MIPSASASTPGPVFVRGFVRVLMLVGVGRCLFGEWDGVHHILQIVVRGPLCSPGDDLSKRFRLGVGILVGHTTRFLEKPGDLTRVILVYPLRAGVESGPALYV